jgi:hypothetical protein
MTYREIIAVCSEIHTKHINTLCGQNVELLYVKPGGTYSYRWALKRRGHSCSHATGTHTDRGPATGHLDTNILRSLCSWSNAVIVPKYKLTFSVAHTAVLVTVTTFHPPPPPSCPGHWITWPNYMIHHHVKIPRSPPQIAISINAGVGTE